MAVSSDLPAVKEALDLLFSLQSRTGSRSWLSFPVPAAVEGKSGENQKEADGGAAGAVDPNINGQGQRASDKNSRYPRIAPAAIRARQVRRGLAHAKERDDCGSIKDPGGKNKKIGQLLERTRQRHQTCQHPLKNQRAAGRAEFRMDASDDLEKNSVAGHGVAHARSAEDG